MHSLVHTIDVIALKLQLETFQYCGSLVLRSLTITPASVYSLWTITTRNRLPNHPLVHSSTALEEGTEGKSSKFGAGWPHCLASCNKETFSRTATSEFDTRNPPPLQIYPSIVLDLLYAEATLHEWERRGISGLGGAGALQILVSSHNRF